LAQQIPALIELHLDVRKALFLVSASRWLLEQLVFLSDQALNVIQGCDIVVTMLHKASGCMLAPAVGAPGDRQRQFTPEAYAPARCPWTRGAARPRRPLMQLPRASSICSARYAWTWPLLSPIVIVGSLAAASWSAWIAIARFHAALAHIVYAAANPNSLHSAWYGVPRSPGARPASRDAVLQQAVKAFFSRSPLLR
jgi:hypothetical protein